MGRSVAAAAAAILGTASASGRCWRWYYGIAAAARERWYGSANVTGRAWRWSKWCSYGANVEQRQHSGAWHDSASASRCRVHAQCH